MQYARRPASARPGGVAGASTQRLSEGLIGPRPGEDRKGQRRIRQTAG